MIVKYVKKIKYRGHTIKKELYGKEIHGKFYPWKRYNVFSKRAVKIERGFKKGRVDPQIVHNYICSLTKVKKNNKIGFQIKENVNYPFFVVSKKNIVDIYQVPNNPFPSVFHKDLYTQLVKSYICKKIFIPIGYDEPYVRLSGKLAKQNSDRGNTILLQLDHHHYVFIGSRIYEFKTKDSIVKYYSPMGNNQVPYPVAIGEKNVYFMLDQTYVPLSYFKRGMKKVDYICAYAYYYGHIGNQALSSFAKRMSRLKIISK